MAKKSWLEVVAACKKSIGNQKKGYSQSGFIDVTVDGKTINTRRDCSGFVSVCLSFYGGKKILVNSTAYTTGMGIGDYLESLGFKKIKWPGFDKTKAGDIYAVIGHVEICAKSGTNIVYNCGSNSSSNNPGPTTSSHKSYSYLWRLEKVKTEEKKKPDNKKEDTKKEDTKKAYTKAEFIKDIETALGMKSPDGKATNATLNKTITLSTKTNKTHKCVYYIQKYLKEKGYNIKVTKEYDRQTSDAVKAYQKKHKTDVDGVITAKEITWKNLLGL